MPFTFSKEERLSITKSARYCIKMCDKIDDEEGQKLVKVCGEEN
jgi:hypothetical protein